MTNEQWLDLFKKIGAKMREGLPDILSNEGGKIPLGKGAGGDKTYPVDKWAEEIVVSVLEEAHRMGESFKLISEELGERAFGTGKKIVLVDPIDGSNNAKNGLPFFATSIALLESNTLADLSVSYIINLSQGDEFWAVRNGGAFQNGKRISTSAGEGIIVVAFEASVPGRDIAPLLSLMKKARRARCFGATALDLAYLAAGAISVFGTAMASRTFDFAAGMLLVKEAGGVITDLHGGPLDKLPAGLDRTVPLLAAAGPKEHAEAVSFLVSRET